MHRYRRAQKQVFVSRKGRFEVQSTIQDVKAGMSELVERIEITNERVTRAGAGEMR